MMGRFGDGNGWLGVKMEVGGGGGVEFTWGGKLECQAEF